MIDYSNNFKKNDNEKIIKEIFTSVDDHEEQIVDDEDNMEMGVIYNTQKVYLREGAGKEFNYLTILTKGDEVFVSGETEDSDGNTWFEVTTAMGIEGFIMSDFVKIEE